MVRKGLAGGSRKVFEVVFALVGLGSSVSPGGFGASERLPCHLFPHDPQGDSHEDL